MKCRLTGNEDWISKVSLYICQKQSAIVCSRNMTIEDVLCETGGFGRFQLFIVLGIGLNRFTVGWSMLQMSYAGMIPGWLCLSSNITRPQNGSLKSCFLNTNDQSTTDVACERFRFVGSHLTIINEWDLVCDLSWIPAALISVQMVGVVLGALVAGQLGDLLGRKKTLYIFILEHAILNFITAFSVSWQMFAACRFFIGIGIGGVLVVSLPYALEFLPLKWRPLASTLPIWSVGICVFSLAALLMDNWSHLHIACAVLSLPGLSGYLYVPESLRWLTVHDRMQEARDVVMKIAITNHKLQPRKASITLQAVAWEVQKAHQSNKQYTYVDIFREWSSTKTTLIFCFHWFTMSLVYYGLSFSLARFTGSVYLNIFILAVVEIPSILSTFYFNNRIGRKRTSICCLFVASVPLLACIIVEIHGPQQAKIAILLVLCLVTKMAIAAAWAVAETWSSEFYETVTRCLGFGTVSMAAGIGALIMPFVIDLDNLAISSFTVMASLLVVDVVLCIFTPETNGLELTDSPPSTDIARDIHKVSENATTTNEINSAASENKESRLSHKCENGGVEESCKESGTKSHENESAISKKKRDGVLHAHFKDEQDEETVSELEMQKEVLSQSPKSSPAPSPRWKKLEKLKISELLHRNSKFETKDDKEEVASSSPEAHIENDENSHKNKLEVEIELTKKSPRPSPASSPLFKRLDQLTNGDIFHGKSKPKNSDDDASKEISGLRKDIATKRELAVPELHTDKEHTDSSPQLSPSSSPRWKRLDKLKNGELFHGKSNSRNKDDDNEKINSTFGKHHKKDKHNRKEPAAPVPQADIYSVDVPQESAGQDLIADKNCTDLSPRGSPSSPRWKRLDKIKSGEFQCGKSKHKHKGVTEDEDSESSDGYKKNNKHGRKELDDTESPTPSPGGSPSSPRWKRLDKIKSGEFQCGKTKNKHRDVDEGEDSESSDGHKKNIKHHDKELNATDSRTPSPGGSPSSPRWKRLEKIKSREFLHGMLKHKNKDQEENEDSDNSHGRLRKDKHSSNHLEVTEFQTENELSTPSPQGSPSSPRWKRLEKIKSGEFLHVKSKPKPKDESPPYIESSHNKNIRFSIY